MSDPIRAVVFGNGFARKVVLPCLRRVPGMEAVGIASPNRTRAEETAREFGLEHVAEDHRELLQQARPDLVFVVTPPDRHREQAVDALRSGCHVVCEKPTALHGGESLPMLEEAALRPHLLSVIDHELRFDPGRRRAREWIAAGRIGRPLRASYVVHSPSRRRADLPWSWWSDADRGGGALGALGSHAVDSLRSLLGEVESVRGCLQTFVRERPDPETGHPRAVTADDFAGAWLRFRSGALATIEVSVVEGERRHELAVAGTEGAIRVVEQGGLWAAFRPDGALERQEAQDDLPTNTELGIPDTDWARSLLRMCREMADRFRSGRTDLPGAATFRDGHENQLVLDAIRRSHETGGWIEPRRSRA